MKNILFVFVFMLIAVAAWAGYSGGGGSGSGTDDQKIDVFQISGTELQLSLEGDAEATKTVELSSLQDGTGTDDQTASEVTITDTLDVYAPDTVQGALDTIRSNALPASISGYLNIPVPISITGDYTLGTNSAVYGTATEYEFHGAMIYSRSDGNTISVTNAVVPTNLYFSVENIGNFSTTVDCNVAVSFVLDGMSTNTLGDAVVTSTNGAAIFRYLTATNILVTTDGSWASE